MSDIINGPASVSGCVKLWHVRQQRWNPATPWQHNDILYDWASIISLLMADGNAGYRISNIYLEYKNVSAPDDIVTVPTFDRSGGISYYNGLASSGSIDYLRVPVIAAVRSSSNQALFPAGNVITFFGQSQGVVGVNGKPFSDANNSKVYGGALVASPVPGDRTQDLVFSRFYFATDRQQLKLPTSQLGITWATTLA